MLRLPVYLLVDSSDEMLGDANRRGIIKDLLDNIIADWKMDPQALELIWLALFSIDESLHQLSPLVEILHFSPSAIKNSRSKPMNFGLACRELADAIRRDSLPKDRPPIVIALMAAVPSDKWEDDAQTLLELIKSNDYYVCSFITFLLFTTSSGNLTLYKSVIPLTNLLSDAKPVINAAWNSHWISAPERKN
jgi:uncharacterized protein YegL